MLALLAGLALAQQSPPPASGRVQTDEPLEPARSQALLGLADPFRTAQTLRRVAAEGAEHRETTRLEAVPSGAPGGPACPLRPAGQPQTCLLANALLERLAQADPLTRAWKLEGRALEVDGIRYVLLTAFEPSAP